MIGTLIIIVVVVAVLAVALGGIALSRSRPAWGRGDRRAPVHPTDPPSPAAAGAPAAPEAEVAASPATVEAEPAVEAAGDAPLVPQPPERRARSLQRSGGGAAIQAVWTRPRGNRWRRR